MTRTAGEPPLTATGGLPLPAMPQPAIDQSSAEPHVTPGTNYCS